MDLKHFAVSAKAGASTYAHCIYEPAAALH
jgi:hypothetical protein